MPTPKRLVLIACCAAAATLVTGCQDSQASRRAEIQELITTATIQLNEASARRADVGQADLVRRTLNGVITSLSAVTDGEPGQRAAAVRLSALAHSSLASLALVEAQRHEADLRDRRAIVDAMIDAALELDALASGLDSVDISDGKQRLARDRDEAGAALRDFGRQMARLDAPIADLRRQNRNDQEQADRLRSEASTLRRDAADLGPALGYGTFEKALQLDRQADRIEHEIAQRELELRFVLEPEHNVAQSRADQAQYRIESSESAEQSLEGVARGMSEAADETRAGISEIRQRVAASVAEIERIRSEQIAELYEQAGADLERAASKLKSATSLVRGEATDAARIEAATAYQRLGDMHWAAAKGLEGHAALRVRLAGASETIDVPVSGTIEDLRASHRQALQEAAGAYGNAEALLGQLAGRNARRHLEVLKSNMNLLEASASGQAVDYSAVAGDVTATAASGSTTATENGSGASSPEDIVAALGDAQDLAAIVRIEVDLTHIDFQTAAERRFYEASMASAQGVLELDAALQEHFNQGMSELLGPALGSSAMMGGGNVDFREVRSDQITLGEVSGNRGMMSVTAGGEVRELPLIRINGKWFVDGTAEFQERLSALADAGMGDPASMIPMMEMTGEVMSNLAQRIRGGEFSSPRDILPALGEAMQGGR